MLRSRGALLRSAPAPSRLRLFAAAKRCGSTAAEADNEPSGYLFGERPPPPGYRRKKEPYENLYVYGYGGLTLAFGIALFYLPEKDVRTWSRNEAIKRAKANGEFWAKD